MTQDKTGSYNSPRNSFGVAVNRREGVRTLDSERPPLFLGSDRIRAETLFALPVTSLRAFFRAR